LHRRRESAGRPRLLEDPEGLVGIGGFEQPSVESQAMRGERRANAAADIKTECSGSLCELAVFVLTRNPREQMEMSLLSGRDEKGCVARSTQILGKRAYSVGTVGSISVNGEDAGVDLNGEGSLGGDRLTDLAPAIGAIVGVDE